MADRHPRLRVSDASAVLTPGASPRRRTSPRSVHASPAGVHRPSRAHSSPRTPGSGRRPSISEQAVTPSSGSHNRLRRIGGEVGSPFSPGRIRISQDFPDVVSTPNKVAASPYARAAKEARKSGKVPTLELPPVAHASRRPFILESPEKRAVHDRRFHGASGAENAKQAFESEILNRDPDNAQDISVLVGQWKSTLVENGTTETGIQLQMRYALRVLVSGENNDYSHWTKNDEKRFVALANLMPNFMDMLLSNEFSQGPPQACVIDHAILALNSGFLKWFDATYVKKSVEGSAAQVAGYYTSWREQSSPKLIELRLIRGAKKSDMVGVGTPAALLHYAGQHLNEDVCTVRGLKEECRSIVLSWMSASPPSIAQREFQVDPDALLLAVNHIREGKPWDDIEAVLLHACGKERFLTPSRRRIGKVGLLDVTPALRARVLNSPCFDIHDTQKASPLTLLNVILQSDRRDKIDLLLKVLQMGVHPTTEAVCDVCRLKPRDSDEKFANPSAAIKATLSAIPSFRFHEFDRSAIQKAVDHMLAEVVKHSVPFLSDLQSALAPFGPKPDGNGLLLKAADFPIEQAIESGDPVFVMKLMRQKYGGSITAENASPVVKMALGKNQLEVALALWRTQFTAESEEPVKLSNCQSSLQGFLCRMSTSLKTKHHLKLFEVPEFIRSCGLPETIRDLGLLKDHSDNLNLLQRAVQNGQTQVFLKCYNTGRFGPKDFHTRPSLFSLAIDALKSDGANVSNLEIFEVLFALRDKLGISPHLSDCKALLGIAGLSESVKQVMRTYVVDVYVSPESDFDDHYDDYIDLYLGFSSAESLLTDRYTTRGLPFLVVMASVEKGVAQQERAITCFTNQLRSRFSETYSGYLSQRGLCNTLDASNADFEPLQLGQSVFHVLAKQPGLSACLSGLMDSFDTETLKACLEQADSVGQTPFHVAAMWGNAETLSAMLVTYSKLETEGEGGAVKPEDSAFLNNLLDVTPDCDMPLDARTSAAQPARFSIWHIAKDRACLEVLCGFKPGVGPQYSTTENRRVLFGRRWVETDLESMANVAYELGNGSAFDFWVNCGAMVKNKDAYRRSSVHSGRLFHRTPSTKKKGQTWPQFSTDVVAEYNRRETAQEDMMAYVQALGLGFYLRRCIAFDDLDAFAELLSFGFSPVHTEPESPFAQLSVSQAVGEGEGDLLLPYLIRHNKPDWVRRLLAHEENASIWWPVLDQHGLGLFHYAVLVDNDAVLPLILNVAQRFRFSVDVQDAQGLSALHWAVLLGKTDAFDALLKARANPCVRCLDLSSPDARRIGVSIGELLAHQSGAEPSALPESTREMAAGVVAQWRARLSAMGVQAPVLAPGVFDAMQKTLGGGADTRKRDADLLLQSLIPFKGNLPKLNEMVGFIRSYQLQGVDVFSPTASGDTLLTRFAKRSILVVSDLENLLIAVFSTAIHPELWREERSLEGFLHAYRAVQNTLLQRGTGGQSFIHTLIRHNPTNGQLIDHVGALLRDVQNTIQSQMPAELLVGGFENALAPHGLQPLETLFKSEMNRVVHRDMTHTDLEGYFYERGVYLTLPHGSIVLGDSALSVAAETGNLDIIISLLRQGALANNAGATMGVLSAYVMRPIPVGQSLDHFDADTSEGLEILLSEPQLPFSWRETLRTSPEIDTLKQHTVLHWAISRGLVKTVKFLMEKIAEEAKRGGALSMPMGEDGQLRAALEYAHALQSQHSDGNSAKRLVPLRPLLYAQCRDTIATYAGLTVGSVHRETAHRLARKKQSQEELLAELSQTKATFLREFNPAVVEFNREFNAFFGNFHSRYSAIMTDDSKSNAARMQAMLELCAEFKATYESEMKPDGRLGKVYAVVDGLRKNLRLFFIRSKEQFQEVGINLHVSLDIAKHEDDPKPNFERLCRMMRGGAKQLQEFADEEKAVPVGVITVGVAANRMGPYAARPPQGKPVATRSIRLGRKYRDIGPKKEES